MSLRAKTDLRSILNLNDFEKYAKRHLPRAIFGYVEGGADDGAAICHNRAAFDTYHMVPRILRDVSKTSQQITLFGRTYDSPFLIAPMGASAIVGYDADNALARAAKAANIPFILSANAITPLEEVGRTYPGCWFAGYQKPDETNIVRMCQRVADAGFSAYILTADVPVGSNRENNQRNGYTMPFRPSMRLALDCARHPAWLWQTGLRTIRNSGFPRICNIDPDRRPSIFSREISAVTGYAHFNWKHAEIMRRHWNGPFIIKGVLSPEDARLAREMGADGIIVSNHGGRQLDCAVSPLDVLGAIKSAAKGLTILADSGFRRGTDIMKGLALGADAILIGRPFLYASALWEEAGINHAIRLLQHEIFTDMSLLGVANCAALHEEDFFYPDAQKPPLWGG